MPSRPVDNATPDECKRMLKVIVEEYIRQAEGGRFTHRYMGAYISGVLSDFLPELVDDGRREAPDLRHVWSLGALTRCRRCKVAFNDDKAATPCTGGVDRSHDR